MQQVWQPVANLSAVNITPDFIKDIPQDVIWSGWVDEGVWGRITVLFYMPLYAAVEMSKDNTKIVIFAENFTLQLLGAFLVDNVIVGVAKHT